MYVQVNVSNEMVSKIDNYAKGIGVSRSALCALFIGQGIVGMENANNVLNNLSERLGDNIINSLNAPKKP